jgi:DNA-binding XRE family transcriptional regulator
MTHARIRCSECEDGVLAKKTIEHDVGALLGMNEVRVTNLPALVCTRCGAVAVEGGVLDKVSLALASQILRRPSLDGIEVRYLRKLLGDTQSDLAEKLGVDRVTVNRWENSPEPIDGAQAYALRSHAFLRLRDKDTNIEAIALAFTEKLSPPEKRRKGYQLDASSLRAA